MASFNKRFIPLFLLLALVSCRPMEEQGGDEPEIYMAVYVIEYANNTGMDIELFDGYFTFPSESPLMPTSESRFHLTLGKNSTETFTISWPHTWYFYVRKTDPGFSERSGCKRRFCSPNKDFAKQRPGLQKCGWSEPWEA
ncbi:MAG: hypothetical protein LBB98_08970 [Treponema sp.]|jgi:hypothetical protein|nr:hypothetical protein [Treponema sp.]